MSPSTLRAVPATFSLPKQTQRPEQDLCHLATCWLTLATHTFMTVTELQAVLPRDLPAQAPYDLDKRTQREVTRGDPSLPQPCVHGHPHGCLFLHKIKRSQVLPFYLARESYLWDCSLCILCTITHLKSFIVQTTGNSEEDPGQRGFG